MYRHDVLSGFALFVQNDMCNVFLRKWKEKEAAGEIADNDEFVKAFVKPTARDMYRLGWQRNPIKDVIFESADLGADDKAIFKLNVYSTLNDQRSWGLTSSLTDGTMQDRIKSMCFEEACKLFRKQELTPQAPKDAAE